jgi:hypothetical protein
MTDIVERLRGFQSAAAQSWAFEAADEIESLRQQLAEAVKMLSEQGYEYNRKTNAIIERHSQQLAECQQKLEMAEAIIAGDGALITGLKNDLAECQEQNAKLSERVVGVGEIAINSVSRDRLAECQAREKVLRDVLREALDYFQLPGQIFNITWAEEVFSMPSDSTALEILKKQWQRGVLLAAADYYQNRSGSHAYDFDIADELRRMAKELE